MNRWVVVGLLTVAAWQAYDRYGRHVQFPLNATPGIATEASTDRSPGALSSAAVPAPPRFVCDGRMHCSQMTSYQEAKFFLQHCPDVKMDGDNDGVPCERQWP